MSRPSPDHRVLFWEDEGGLVEEAGRFLAQGLARGEGAVAITHPARHAALRAQCPGLAEAEARGDVLLIDSAAVAREIQADGALDVARFAAVVQRAMGQVGGRPTRFFGEVVGDLAAEGRHTEALVLEALGQEVAVAAAGHVRILCAYPMGALAASRSAFEAVCGTHTGQAVTTFPPTQDPSSHTVRFFEDDVSLTAYVGGFLSEGTRNGEPAVAIARRSQLDSLRPYREAAQRQGAVWVGVDADEALAFLAPGDRPDPVRFRHFMAHLATQLPAGRFRAFGEMVDVLAARGRWDAAVELERIWNEYAEGHGMALLCGCSAEELAKAPRATFRHACMEHETVQVSAARARGVVDLLEQSPVPVLIAGR